FASGQFGVTDVEHQESLNGVDVVPTHAVELVLDQIKQAPVQTLNPGNRLEITRLQALGTVRNDGLGCVGFDRHLCLTVCCVCDFSDVMGPSYCARTKLSLSGVIKSILLESNENVALFFVTPVEKIVTLRVCEEGVGSVGSPGAVEPHAEYEDHQ